MNLSASQCGSGCESGWTFYLDQSSCSQTGNFGEDYGVKGARFVVEDDEEEGLSMVSDASSGPRQHCYCQENGCFSSHPSTTQKPDKKSCRNINNIKDDYSNNQQRFCLDDTASSPKNFKGEASADLDFSQGFSGTHFKVVSRKEAGDDKKGKLQQLLSQLSWKEKWEGLF
ncbi:Detected protein of unknown function [Hibiscus syriacus]|uniref:Uncharacterized protein n=1 Tax=Hibiscus syriacus TaxID=106335 RepID=A0A6A2Z1G3_HIBSY|nr:Detected protein of unknown function [Hibiscus syriacus]